MSRPTRAAWIETAIDELKLPVEFRSRPTRAAWIETVTMPNFAIKWDVAAHTGRVD